MEHPKFRSSARRVTECISAGNSGEIMDLIGNRHAKSHPHVLGTAGLHEPEDYVFLDIETMGLFSRPIILFGVGFLEHGRAGCPAVPVARYCRRTGSSSGNNGSFLFRSSCTGHLQRKSIRCPLYLRTGLPTMAWAHFQGFLISMYSISAGGTGRINFPHCALPALEKEILGVHRADDVPGQMVPEFYETYLRTGNCGPLVPVVEHNRQDVVSLARLVFPPSGGCIMAIADLLRLLKVNPTYRNRVVHMNVVRAGGSPVRRSSRPLFPHRWRHISIIKISGYIPTSARLSIISVPAGMLSSPHQPQAVKHWHSWAAGRWD